MTGKDYVRLANSLAWSYNVAVSMGQQGGVALAIRGVMNALQEDNLRFDKERFIQRLEQESCYNHGISQLVLDRSLDAEGIV